MTFSNEGHSWSVHELNIVVDDELHDYLLQNGCFMEVGHKKVICSIFNIDGRAKTHFTFLDKDGKVVLVGCSQEFRCQVFLLCKASVDELEEDIEGYWINICDFNLCLELRNELNESLFENNQHFLCKTTSN